MSLLTKVKGWFSDGAEGSWRGPFNGIGEFGNSFPMGRIEDGWQRNLSLPYADSSRVAIVYACVQAYSRAVSTCVTNHYRRDSSGRYEIVENSWPARLLRNPNDYETWSQHIYNTTAELGFRGSSIDFIIRDDRNVPISLHRIPHGSWTLHVEPQTRAVFYGHHGNSDSIAPIKEPDFLIPARDIIHYRVHCPRHHLIGESPIAAASLAVGINVALSSSQAAFFQQMRRPSGLLTTDQKLTKEQILRLREAFDEQSKTWAQGGVPILSNNLKFQAMSITAQDAQLIDAQKMSQLDICRVYAIPPPIVGILENATFSNSEALINHWLATGLGSMLENMEQSLSKAFGFGVGESIDFETDSLLRSDAKSRIETLTKGIIGGLYTPNESRAKEFLPPIEGGDSVYLQQQNAPIARLDEYFAGVIANQQRNTGVDTSQTAKPDTATDDNADGTDNTDQQAAKTFMPKPKPDDIVFTDDIGDVVMQDIVKQVIESKKQAAKIISAVSKKGKRNVSNK